MTTLAELRTELAEAKAALREAKGDHETMKAIREQAAIDRGLLGACKNEGERTRVLTIVLDQDNDYLTARQRLRESEYAVDQLAADIATAEDERETLKLRIRDEANRALDHYAAALERLTRSNPIHTAIDAALPL